MTQNRHVGAEDVSLSFERIHEEAFAIEQVHFKKTDKRVNPKRVDPFLFLPGKGPILVSAPHSVRTIRNGKKKSSDMATGSLAFLLHREAGCHALAVKKLYGGDPNWDDPCIYKDRLRGIVGAQGVRFVLDLHGAKKDREFDVDIGTMHGKSLLGRTQIREMIVRSLEKEGITAISDNVFPAEKQSTVTKFCAESLGIPAVQLEISLSYRAPNRNGKDFGRLFRSLAAVVEGVASQV